MLVRCTMMSETVEVAEIEDAAEHVAVDLHHAAFLVMQLDGAADLLMRREHVGIARRPRRRTTEGLAHENCMAARYRREDSNDDPNERRHGQGHAVGVDDGVGLGQDLGEHDDQQRS